jgi:hypothetical protein
MSYKAAFVVVPIIALLLVTIPYARQQNAHAQNQTLACTGG